MAIYKLFPEKDLFISSEIPLGNTGRDEILEIAGHLDSVGKANVSRILLQFSSVELKDLIDNKVGENIEYSASLCVYLADAYDIPLGYTIYGYPVSTGWDNGTGKYGDLPTNNTGASWFYRSVGGTNNWADSNFETGVTGSFTPGTTGGGTWFTGSLGVNMESIQSHGLYSSHDIELDVTNSVVQHYNETLENNGFIIKLEDSLEYNTSASINLKYYSRDTNTIYPPSLNIKWDDSLYSTGSLETLLTGISTIGIINNSGKYKGSGKQRFRLAVRPKYPARTFSTNSIYLKNYALPRESYWGLVDDNTEEMVVDFDVQFTKVSCDTSGPFFDTYMDGLQPERYYRIVIKTDIDGSTTIVDSGNIFKVVRNG